MHLSFRTKVWLAFVLSGFTAMFLIFALGNWYINELQKANKEAAVSLAQEQARQLQYEILDALDDYRFSDISDAALRQRLKTQTEVILRLNKNVVWAGVVDPAGNRVIVHSSADEQVIEPQLAEGGMHKKQFDLPGAGELELVVAANSPKVREITQAVQHEGKPMAEVRLRVLENPTYQRIETTSRQITRALIMESALLLFFLLVVFWFLWKLFSRQLHLAQKNAELDRMAYVGTLASGLAHEIRNPLSAMNVNLEVMREEIAEDHPERSGKAGELASRVQREVLQLNAILTSFLEFALPARHNLHESTMDFSLRALIDELMEAHSEQMRQHDITFEVNTPPGADLIVEADRRLIYQALRNVILNALQVLQNSVKKHVSISAENVDGKRVRITVSDTGPGIAEENLGRIFDLFFSTRKGGSGFGLAIARKIVEEHGGRISARNHEDRLGASFVIELPRVARNTRKP